MTALRHAPQRAHELAQPVHLGEQLLRDGRADRPGHRQGAPHLLELLLGHDLNVRRPCDSEAR
jgi:hypothetical protein